MSDPMAGMTEDELMVLLGKKEVELYILRRNLGAMAQKMNEMEAELKGLRAPPEKKRKGKGGK